MKNILSLLSAAFVLSCGFNCSSAVVYYWNGNDTASPTSGSDPKISVGAVTRVNGGGTTISDSSSPSSGYAGVSGGNNFQTACQNASFSINSSTYFSVTFTPSAGYAISLDSISLGTRSTATGPTLISLYSSIDNYASAIGSVSVSANGTWALVSPSLSGSLDGALDTPVSFRIYGSGGTSTVASNWRIDDISLTVTPVPEPVTWALIVFVTLASTILFGRFLFIRLTVWN